MALLPNARELIINETLESNLSTLETRQEVKINKSFQSSIPIYEVSNDGTVKMINQLLNESNADLLEIPEEKELMLETIEITEIDEFNQSVSDQAIREMEDEITIFREDDNNVTLLGQSMQTDINESTKVVLENVNDPEKLSNFYLEQENVHNMDINIDEEPEELNNVENDPDFTLESCASEEKKNYLVEQAENYQKFADLKVKLTKATKEAKTSS